MFQHYVCFHDNKACRRYKDMKSYIEKIASFHSIALYQKLRVALMHRSKKSGSKNALCMRKGIE